jgi:hypothetical protein
MKYEQVLRDELTELDRPGRDVARALGFRKWPICEDRIAEELTFWGETESRCSARPGFVKAYNNEYMGGDQWFRPAIANRVKLLSALSFARDAAFLSGKDLREAVDLTADHDRAIHVLRQELGNVAPRPDQKALVAWRKQLERDVATMEANHEAWMKKRIARLAAEEAAEKRKDARALRAMAKYAAPVAA